MTWKLPPPDSKGADVWSESCDDNDYKLFLLSGAVRSSKTVCSLIAFADRVASGPIDAPRMMIGNTERTLKRNCLDPLQQFVGKRNMKINLGTGEINLFGRKIYIAGASNIGQLSRFQGPTLLDAYLDEAVTYPEPIVNMIMSRLSLPDSKAWMTFNPAGPGHHIKKNFIDRADEIRARVWNFTLDDNSFLTDEYKDWLKSIYTGLFYKRYILGEWAVSDGVIFDNFNPDIHVISKLPDKPMDSMRVGVDYGSVNPTVFIKACRFDNTWIITDEFYHKHSDGDQYTNAQYKDQMIKFIDGYFPTSIEVDPSAAAFIFELRKCGLRGVRGANNDVVNGIQRIATAFNSGNLLISDKCPHLIEELQSYAWDSRAALLGLDKPIKSNDHACDALRYVINAIYN